MKERSIACNVVSNVVTRKQSKLVKERSIAFIVVSNVVTRVVTNEAAWAPNEPTAQNDSSATCMYIQTYV